jgi:hypothetical protein
MMVNNVLHNEVLSSYQLGQMVEQPERTSSYSVARKATNLNVLHISFECILFVKWTTCGNKSQILT